LNDASQSSASDSSTPRNWWLWGGIALAVIVLLALFSGNESQRSGADPNERVTSAGSDGGTLGKDLFDSATSTLNRLEEFDTEPALRLVVDRLNQWIQYERPKGEWQLDPLVKTLPKEPNDLQSLPELQNAANLRFTNEDAQHLLETNWLRNITEQLRQNEASELALAQDLFDWTIRNIQLDDEPARITSAGHDEGVPMTMRELLLFGHGDYLHRAAVFMLLARQANLPVVLLAVPDARRDDGLRPWAAALVSDGELYLFDTQLGLPIPGPEGKGVATLAQVGADDGLLRALDMPGDRYRMRAEQLKDLVALVEASPGYLSRRMAEVESRLAGDRRVALSVDVSGLAEALKSQPLIKETRIWARPYETLWQRAHLEPQQWQPMQLAMAPFMIRFDTPRRGSKSSNLGQDEHPLFTGQGQDDSESAARAQLQYQACSLWMGRVMHFKGKFTSEGNLDGATTHYLEVRVSDDKLEEVLDKFVASVRFADERMATAFRQSLRVAIPEGKQHASYWLGLVAYERGNYPVAIDYFKKRTLADSPDGPWTYGATYNLARTYEAQAAELTDKPDEAAELRQQAIELLDNDDSPQSHGNRQRAARLKTQLTKKADS
jgi:hypothetical protein